MANSVKVLNWVDPDGDYIKFYTELNSEFEVGERVFIAGGPYDNTMDAINDPFSAYAAGYTVLSVDKTNLSNSVTLNINNQDVNFIDDTNATIFAVYEPYYTAEQLEYIESLQYKSEDTLTDEEKVLLTRDNFSNEAWITKNHFKTGEFNGGTFQDGILGQYKVKNSAGENAPVDNFETYFNRKNENTNANWTGGIFLGGNWQWGVWNSRYAENQYGKYQQLNEQGGIKDPLDESRLLIQEFNDNFAGAGWNMVASGNFGRIWKGETGMKFDPNDQTITFEFVPFALRRGLNTAFNIQIEIEILNEENSIRNSRLYTLNYDYTTADPLYDDWNEFTLYRTGSIISHNQFVYVSIDDEDAYNPNLDKDPETSTIFWEKYDTWSSTVTYVADDVVALNGVYYISLISNTNTTPDSSSTIWQKTDKQLLRENTLRVFERIFAVTGSAEFLSAVLDVVVADPEQTLLDETDLLIEYYKNASNNNDFIDYNVFAESKKLKNVKPYKRDKHNNFNTGRFQNGDWFNGLWFNSESWQLGDFQGGDWWNGELKFGRIGSSYDKTIWHNGFINGTVNRTLAGDLFWENGIWLNGTWEGAKKFKVDSLIKQSDSRTNIQLHITWANMIDVGDTITMSYFKGSNSRLYLDLWTNDLDVTLLEFQTFTVSNKVVDYNKLRVLLTIDLNLDALSVGSFSRNIYDELILDLNYQHARIHNSRFDKGLWIDGTWSTGYLKGKLNKITKILFDRNDPDILGIETDDISNLKLGDFIELSNIKIVHLFDFKDVLPGTNMDDRNLVEFWQNLDQVLQIQEITSEEDPITEILTNTIYVDLSRLNNDIEEESEIIGVEEYYDNSIAGWSYQVWENGTFNSGIFEDVIWKDGHVDNVFVEDPTNTQIKTVWRSGVWKNGLWNNGAFLSGIWENGEWNNGFMTNGWKRSTEFWTDDNSWQQSDSIWMNGTWNNGRWIRGMWNDGTFLNGSIENAGIDKIEILDGNYTNGREDMNGDAVFSSELTTNNSLGAAPSLIYLDQDGWAQLDQSSWYQKDYNIIFKDLNQPSSGFPWDDQMFDVLERDETGSRLRISVEGATNALSGNCWAGTSGNDKDVLQDTIDSSLPLLVIRNIVGISEIATNVFWVADGVGRILDATNENVKDPNTGDDLVIRGYNRIVEINKNQDKTYITSIQETLNTGSSFKLKYDDIIKITTNVDAEYTYTLESTLIRKINRSTFDNDVVITISELQDNSEINLVEWFDFALFAETASSPETLFIFATFNENNNIKFNIVTIFPNGESSPAFLYIATSASTSSNDPDVTINSDIRIRFNQWLTAFTAQDLSFDYVNFRGHNTDDSNYLLYQKLPIDVAIPILENGSLLDPHENWDEDEEEYYREQNIQKQRITFSSNKWTMLSFEPNINYTLFTSKLNEEFVDYVTQRSSGIESEIIWFLQQTRSTIFYNSLGTVALLPLGSNTSIKSINLGKTNILAILNDNVTPLIIPKDIVREGFGLYGVAEPDHTDYPDNIQYKQRTLNFLTGLPVQDELDYWIWDYPTKRIINANETLSGLYNIDGEFGAEGDIKFNEILFINKTAVTGELVYIDQYASERSIRILDTNSSILNIIEPDTSIRSLNVDYTFIDGTHTNSIVSSIELISLLYVIEAAGEYNYSIDTINLRTGETSTLDIPNTYAGINIINPNHVALSTEISNNNTNIVYVVDDFGVISSEEEVIFKTNWDETNITSASEQTKHVAVYSANGLHIMYVVTLTDQLYSVYRLTKNNIDSTIKLWPGHSSDIEFTLKPNDIIHTTTDKILEIKNIVVGADDINDIGLEILTDTGYTLIAKNYDATQPKGILSWIEYDELSTGETTKYGFDVSNRIIRFDNISSDELEETNSYGQYMQPFQYGTYIRNASSMHYAKFNYDRLKKFIIFIDDKLEPTYDVNGENLLSYTQTKKYIRSVELNDTANPNSVTINTIFDGDLSLNALSDPYGSIITGGTITDANYEVIDLWCDAPLSRASIYILVLNHDTVAKYQLIKLEMENNGDVSYTVLDVADEADYSKFVAFTATRRDSTKLTEDYYYLATSTDVYRLTFGTTNTIESLATITGTVDQLISKPSSDSATLDDIFVKSIGTETHLFTFEYSYNSTAGPVYDDDRNDIFIHMNSISLSADKASLLIANDTTLDRAVINSRGTDPDFVATYSISDSYNTIIETEEVTNYNYTTVELPPYATVLETDQMFNAYYKESIDTDAAGEVARTLISPHVNGRVLKDTIWSGSGWNTGSDTRNLGYTAHMVSSSWLGGQFVGSWDTPSFFNHQVLTTESKFIDGIFGGVGDGISGIWNDGLFLGGRWVSGEFKKGHFISEKNITVDAISFPGAADSYVRVNQVTNAKYDFDADLFKLDLDHFYWNEYYDGNDSRDATKDSYIEAESQLVRQSLIQIPGLFQDIKLEIYEIRKGKYQIEGRNEIILLTRLPDFDIPDEWLEQSLVYLMGFTENIAYLHGIHYVTDTFKYNNTYWITVQSNFNDFDENERYEILDSVLPYVTLGPFKIECIENKGTSSSIWFNLPLPNTSQFEQIQFLKNNLILKSIDVIDRADALDLGAIVSPEQVLVFDRSASGSAANIDINSVNIIQNMLFKNVRTISFLDDTTDKAHNISDIVLIESSLKTKVDQTGTIPDTFTLYSPEPSIINSLIYSGETDLSIKTSGWLNQDNTGFNHASSTFSGSYFEGDMARIISVVVTDDSEYLVIDLESLVTSIAKNRFIFLRGFSGNKARVIGSSFSKAFRIVDVESNRIKIRNPFKLYNIDNIETDVAYQTKFSYNGLLLHNKTMKLEHDTDFTFFYAYASNSAWNGGTFTGVTNSYSKFNSVWNAGKFNANDSSTVFNGEWFGTPFSYYYAGPLNVEVSQDDTSFTLEIDLEANGILFDNNDFVYVQFLNDEPNPFYATVKDNKITNNYQIYYPEGEYIVQITRYVVQLDSGSNQLILDQNLDVGPEKDSIYHTIFDTNTFDYSNGNTVLNFRSASAGIYTGVLAIDATYVLKALSNQNIIFDMYVSRKNVTTIQTVLNFKLDEVASFRVVLSATSVYVWYQEESDTTETSALPEDRVYARRMIDTGWHHLYVEYIADTALFKFVLNGVDIITIDSNDINYHIISSGWTFDSVGPSALPYMQFNKNLIECITIGQGHQDSKISYQGYVDNIRFWNTPRSITEIQSIATKRYMSYNVSELDAKLTFDDRESEIKAPFIEDRLILSQDEYIANIELPDDYNVKTVFRIDQLRNDIRLIYLYGPSASSKITISTRPDRTVVMHMFDIHDDIYLELSKEYELSFYYNWVTFTDMSTGEKLYDQELNPPLHPQYPDDPDERMTLAFGLNYVYLSSIVSTNNISVTSNGQPYMSINSATISGLSDAGLCTYSLNPITSNYATVEQSNVTTDPGSALITLQNDYTNWTYLLGDSIYTTTVAKSDGSETDPSITYYDAEIFQLDDNGDPVWSIDNVSLQSQFVNGNFNSSLWRAGEMKGGIISNDESKTFIWKWGLNSGGTITDI